MTVQGRVCVCLSVCVIAGFNVPHCILLIKAIASYLGQSITALWDRDAEQGSMVTIKETAVAIRSRPSPPPHTHNPDTDHVWEHKFMVNSEPPFLAPAGSTCHIGFSHSLLDRTVRRTANLLSYFIMPWSVTHGTATLVKVDIVRKLSPCKAMLLWFCDLSRMCLIWAKGSFLQWPQSLAPFYCILTEKVTIMA